jgi:hypothetical protein
VKRGSFFENKFEHGVLHLMRQTKAELKSPAYTTQWKGIPKVELD